MAGPTREEARLAQVMQEAFDKIANRMDRMERGMKSTADSAKKISDYSSKSLDDIEKTISAEQNRAAVMQSIAETEVSNFQRRAEAFLAASEAQLEVQRATVARQEAINDLAAAEGSLTQEMVELLDEKRNAFNEINEVLEAQILHQEGAANLSKDMAKTLKGLAGIGDELGLSGQFAAAVVEGGTLTDVIKDITEELGVQKMAALALDSTQAKLTEGIGGLIGMALKQAFAVDTQQASLRKLIGGMDDYDEVLNKTFQSQKFMGVTAEDAGRSISTLFQTTSQFTELGDATQASLISTSTIMERAGVSAESFASGLETSMKSLGATAEEARQTQTDLLRFSTELGVAPQKMAEEYSKAGPMLAKFGNGAERMFKNVAKAAKATGLEMGRIIDFTKQFDTFEGAADKVGSLNAMLGGDFVNAMDLMAETDPAKRMKMITDAVSESGRAFESMGYYEKEAIAAAGGFADVNELAKAMSGDMDSLSTSTEAQALSQAELDQIAKDTISTLDKMNASFQGMAEDLQPLVKQFRELLDDHIVPFVEKHGTKMIYILGGMKVAMFAAQMATAAHTLGISLQTGMMALRNVTKLKSIALDKIETLQIIGLIALDKLRNVTKLKSIALDKIETLQIIGLIALDKARAASLWLMNSPLVAAAVSYGTAMLAAMGFNVAAGAVVLPILAIVAAIAAVGAAFYLLYQNYDTVVSMFKKAAVFLFNALTMPFRTGVKMAVKALNFLIEKGNRLPGINIPTIGMPSFVEGMAMPALARGVDSFSGGMALVGEEGPEMVTLPPRASVAPASTTAPAVQTAKALAGLGRRRGGRGKGGPVNINVTLELDKRVLARHTEEVMIDKLNPAVA